MCYIVFVSHSLHWRYIKTTLQKYVIMHFNSCVLQICVLFLNPSVSLHIGLSEIHLKLFAEGCEDPTVVAGTCGIARIEMNGIDVSPRRRGINVAVIDFHAGNFKRVDHFCESNESMSLSLHEPEFESNIFFKYTL